MKLRNIFAATALAILAISCTQEQQPITESAEYQALLSEKQQLETNQTQKDSALANYFTVLNQIEQNLNDIQLKQNYLKTAKLNENNDSNIEDRIFDDINFINTLMENNKAKLKKLAGQLEKSNLKIVSLNQTIALLEQRLQEREADIEALKVELARTNAQLEELFAQYNERVYELNEKDESLNKAYYAYGTLKELKDSGVVSKKGGFVGLGGIIKLSENFNKDYFTEIDIRSVKSLPFNFSKVELVTNHPSSSYELKTNDSSTELVIVNAEEFWSVSKYLVVRVD